jgi:hypothetical protein
MAEFHRAANGAGWLKITWLELAVYSENAKPICDECLKSLIGCDEVVLLPILNEAYCPVCGPERIARLHRYPEDRATEKRREQFWINYFEIKEVTV